MSSKTPAAALTGLADTLAGEPLTLAHRDELEVLLATRWMSDEPAERTLSDPWFTNLYLFRAAHDWRFLRGPHPCVAGRAYDGARILVPLFDLQAAPQAVLGTLLQAGGAFGPLSDAQAACLDPVRFRLEHRREDADYLYPAENFLHYRGTLLNKKRNLLKQLRAEHTVEVQPYTEALAGEAQTVLDGWMRAKGRRPGEADDTACSEALMLCGLLGLHGFLHCIGGAPVGFVLAQRIRPGVAVMRFAKGLDAFKGIYQHMFQHYCEAMPDIRWLNFEQDLGHANFRHTKMSYRPAALLAKHRATLRARTVEIAHAGQIRTGPL